MQYRFPSVQKKQNREGNPRNYAVPPLGPGYPAQSAMAYPEWIMSNRPLSGLLPSIATTVTSSSVTTRPNDQIEG